jgi:hypothetical protein
VTNLGPTYTGLKHEPVIPAADQPIEVAMLASDPQGIAEVTLHYRIGAGDWQSESMLPSGAGRFTATLAGQPARTQVQFYVSGTDSAGASSTYPAAGADSRALIQVEDGRARPGVLHNLRVIVTSADNSAMHRNTELMSNARRGATVVINESEVVYDVGLRLNGASSSRQGSQNGYNLEFPADEPFRGVHQTISVDRNNVNEILIRQLINHAGGVPGLYNDAIYFVGPNAGRSGFAQLRMARYENEYLATQYENGADGLLFEKELTYRQSLTSALNRESLKAPQGYTHPVELNTDIQDLGDDKEAYRWHWLVQNHRDRDDYRQIIALNQAMSLNGSELDAATREVMDVDEWLRTFAAMRLFGNRDFYTQPSGDQGHWKHNFYVYQRPSDDKLLVLPWDIDENFQIATNSTIFGVGNLVKFIQLPDNLHYYYGHLENLMNRAFNLEYLTPWADHFASLFPSVDFRTPRTYIDARTAFVRGQLPAPVDFEVKSASLLAVSGSQAVVTGLGWINVRQIAVVGSDVPLEVEWPTPTTWQAVVPLDAGENQLQFQAFDFDGQPIASPFANRLTVTSTLPGPAQLQHLRITELNVRPAAPSLGEIAAGFERADDFSYVELVNTSMQPLDLRGARLTQGIVFDLSDAATTQLLPGQRIVVAEDAAALRFRYGDEILVAGSWTGNLDADGEAITLVDHRGAVIHQFVYDTAAPWPTLAGGNGASLEVIDTSGDYSSPANWTVSRPGGTPGEPRGASGDFDGDGALGVGDIDRFFQGWKAIPVDRRLDLTADGAVDVQDRDVLIRQLMQTNYGDANLDGLFNSRDLVQLLQIGEYEDDIAGNSGWSEGDFDGDAEFGTSDLVLIFQTGGYLYE